LQEAKKKAKEEEERKRKEERAKKMAEFKNQAAGPNFVISKRGGGGGGGGDEVSCAIFVHGVSTDFQIFTARKKTSQFATIQYNISFHVKLPYPGAVQQHT